MIPVCIKEKEREKNKILRELEITIANFFLKETPLSSIEETFIEYTKRKDIAIILINQHVSYNQQVLIILLIEKTRFYNK